MISSGSIINAVVSDQNGEEFFAQYEGQTLRLVSAQQDWHLKDEVTGFAYENKKDQWVLTTEIPAVGMDRYAYGTVVQVRRDLGVFIDIGLPDKDIVLSLDDLPLMHNLWPQQGDRLMIALKRDHKNRLWAQLANDDLFKEIGHFSPDFDRNETVTGTVYLTKRVGSFLLLNDYRLGFIHETEREDEPRIGQEVTGRVIGRMQDGRLSISLKPLAFVEIQQDAQMLLAVLQRDPKHAFIYHDKSDPTIIKDYFGISKGAFKRALGNLLKNGLITTDDTGTKLTEKGIEYRG
ncbi:translation initiation factor IF-3 [Lapidilactobacillus concavus DSM 17758]|jgi:predicted RNA-binding protein (virulence factor B family)|uniref:Translation initiation factor IF-3 n=1 Tax=Lapidilactobacillus concavus DSM 17758 TaxID=1423735 RepID=A0A0R1WE93_9LACO|nr:S1-like domain-containing RNA-binding protein [Lapidilactobacillus concavus]KRM13947.1 translation initiation factor IF-3 [Lapidilactobacillus concavus DSM 17758]GEL13095.1 S1 RNA-binding protein [Lapidilactobacillus concavus]